MGKWFAMAALGIFTAACAQPQSAVAAAAVEGRPGSGKLIAEIHFSGVEAIDASPNAATLRGILQMPETARLRDQALNSLATNLTRAPGGGAKGDPQLLRPLLNDLYRSPWRAESYAQPGGSPLCLLAVHTPGDSAARWNTNLWQNAQKMNGSAPKAADLAGMRGWSGQQGDRYFGVFQKGSVTLVATGPQAPQASTRLLAEVAKSGNIAKSENFLSVNVPSSATTQIEWLKPFAGIKVAFKTGNDDSVRVSGEMNLAHPFNARLEPWRVPTNTITHRISGFTAVRGASAWLSSSPWLAKWPVEKWPNQFFVWSEIVSPFSISAAAQFGNPTNLIRNLERDLVPQWNREFEKKGWGQVVLADQPLVLSWRSLPIAIPFLRPGGAGDEGFLHAGLFPTAAGTEPFPAPLLQQLKDRPNLLYYDWEITEGRLFQLRPLRQLQLIVGSGDVPDPNSPGEQWLKAIEPKLGNAITEVTVQSPQRLGLIRKSHLGLTSIELTALALWLQNPKFPAPELDLTGKSPRAARRSQPQPAGNLPAPGSN